MLHVTWTEWKNLFSLEIYCRTAKLQVDGLVRSYGPQTLRIYRMRPELGPARARGASTIPTEDLSWTREWEHFAEALVPAMAAGSIGDLADAHYAWAQVEDAYAGSRTRGCGRRRLMSARRVLVTGGSMGIGRASRALAAHGAGRCRSLHAARTRSGGRLARAAGEGHGRGARTSATSAAGGALAGRLAELDGLVCAAGVLDPDRPDRQRMSRPSSAPLEINLLGHAARRAPLPAGLRARGGAVVTLQRRRRDRPAAALRRLRGFEGRRRATTENLAPSLPATGSGSTASPRASSPRGCTRRRSPPVPSRRGATTSSAPAGPVERAARRRARRPQLVRLLLDAAAAPFSGKLSRLNGIRGASRSFRARLPPSPISPPCAASTTCSSRRPGRRPRRHERPGLTADDVLRPASGLAGCRRFRRPAGGWKNRESSAPFLSYVA